jgi:hypothetical protein
LPAEALLASPFAALPDIIRARAAEHPDPLALVEGGEALTYGGLAALMDRIAFALQRDGVRAGEAVAICARTSINYVAAFCEKRLRWRKASAKNRSNRSSVRSRLAVRKPRERGHRGEPHARRIETRTPS